MGGKTHNRIRQYTIMAVALVIVLTTALVSAGVSAAVSHTPTAASSLSRWLSRDIVPALREELGHHPRFEQAGIRIIAGTPDGLAEAIARVLVLNLQNTAGVRLHQPTLEATAHFPDSVDDIDCSDQQPVDYVLRVSVASTGTRQSRVELALVEQAGPARYENGWQWQGTLTAAERETLAQAAVSYTGRGTLESPWTRQEFGQAAVQLARDLACALRPQVDGGISLSWGAAGRGDTLFTDTVHASRALLAGLGEISLAGPHSDYRIETRIQPLDGEIWQFWLSALPEGELVTRQAAHAITYFVAPGIVNAPESFASATKKTPTGKPAGEPIDHIRVELLDTLQSDSAGSRVTLVATVRIANDAEWPMDYSFTLSGGHFNHCVAKPEFYRHDRYGTIKGSLQPGETRVQRLTIERAMHRPTPLFGMRQCAGFRDLDGFENFASRGYKITDYVRWLM